MVVKFITLVSLLLVFFASDLYLSLPPCLSSSHFVSVSGQQQASLSLESQTSLQFRGDGKKRAQKMPAKESKKSPMKGKGGLENSNCNCKGVRQWSWGKWVVEIQEPNRLNRLWLSMFSIAINAALAFDEAARAMSKVGHEF